MAVVKLDQVAEREPMLGFKGRFVHAQEMTLVCWAIAAGAMLPEHSHPHEQITAVLDGEFEMVVSGEAERLGPGSVIAIPSQAVHSGRAVTACRIIDVFHPVREDYR